MRQDYLSTLYLDRERKILSTIIDLNKGHLCHEGSICFFIRFNRHVHLLIVDGPQLISDTYS